jgi:hypothetical protein
MMDHISSLTTIKKIRKWLMSLPSDHQEAYQSTFDRIFQQGSGRSELALTTLTWICNVKWPLTMNELQHAIAIEGEVEQIGPEDLESSKTILSACLSLVVMSKSDQTVNLIHSTARSFILGNQMRMDREPHLTISQACLTYMSVPEMAKGPCNSVQELERRLSLLPFLRYSTRYYGYHVKELEPVCLTQLASFLKNEQLRGSSWQVLHFVVGTDHELANEIFASIPSGASVLHVAAYWGFSNLLALLAENESVPSKEVVQFYIDGHDSHGWTPLHWAASMGHINLAKDLLNSGAEIDSADSARWTPLFWAVFKGHDELVTELLQRGANCLHTDGDGMTPLH